MLEGFQPERPYWLDEQVFAAHFRRSPIKRARRSGMLRNVCVALGNWAAPEAVAPLVLALQDAEPLARGHAAWGLGQVLRKQAHEQAYQALCERLGQEQDSQVQEEIAAALNTSFEF